MFEEDRRGERALRGRDRPGDHPLRPGGVAGRHVAGVPHGHPAAHRRGRVRRPHPVSLVLVSTGAR